MSNKISVIIPVYNAERTIERCIDSVLAQTHEEIEVICVVDGAEDESANILYSYAERDARIKVVEQAGSGPATARNAGLDAAVGDFIGFVDADDYIDPAMYARLLKAMEGVELANCGHISFFADGTEKVFSTGLRGTYIVRDADALGLLITSAPDFIWDKLFDARIIREKDIRFPDGRVYGEDSVFLVKYMNHVKKAFFAIEPLYYYNAHSEGSITNTISDKWYDIFENLKDILYYYRENLSGHEFEDIKPYLEELCIRYYDRRANAMIRYEEKDFQVRYVKFSFEFLTQNFPDWKERMRRMPGVAFPGVKTSLLLMRLFIFMPGILKRRYAGRLSR